MVQRLKFSQLRKDSKEERKRKKIGEQLGEKEIVGVGSHSNKSKQNSLRYALLKQYLV